MKINTSLSPLPDSKFGPAEASHLLRRVGYGPTPGSIAKFVEMGPQAAVDTLIDIEETPQGDIRSGLDLDPDIRKPLTQEQRKRRRMAYRDNDEDALEEFRELRNEANREDRRLTEHVRDWWVKWMARTPRPMEETMTLFWHNHFASRQRNVRDAYLMAQQNFLFRKHALDNFGKLCFAIVRDPAMLIFLNNNQNNRNKPNENLARELMELFTLGEGNYSETDIMQGARALTGYFVHDNDFIFNKRAHDDGSKTLLSRKGDFDGDGFVRVLLEQKACSQYISYKIYRHLVADIPDEPQNVSREHRRVLVELATTLRKHKYELKPMLKQMLRSEHFYDASTIGMKIKSPTEVAVGTMRMLQTPMRDPKRIWQAMGLAGQMLLDPPTVAGWSGGRAWINTSTLFIRQNLASYLIVGQPHRKDDAFNAKHVYNEIGTGSNNQRVDRLIDWLVGHHITEDRRRPIADFVNQHGDLDHERILKGTLLLVTAMPEYQLT